MQAKPTRPFSRLRGLAVCLLLSIPMQGCAAITGALTGGFTGFVDFPSTTVPSSPQGDSPDFYAAAFVLAPTGMVLGPFLGFVKGLALDISWVTGQVSYGDVYGSYGHASVWRPYQWEWIEDHGGGQR